MKEDSDLMIVSQNGKMIRIESATIRQAGRSTQGVRLVNLEEGDKVAAACVIPEAEEPPTTVRRRFRFSKLGCRAAMATLGRSDNSGGIEEKAAQATANLPAMGRVIVAFSGGTDSAYLAWAANRALGANAVAITADSASLPESHKRDAEEFVERFGIAHEYIETHEFDNPDYVRNDPDRCFHCKDELFTRLEEVGRERGYQHIIYGVNMDDLGDYRPGQNAARQHRWRRRWPMPD